MAVQGAARARRSRWGDLGLGLVDAEAFTICGSFRISGTLDRGRRVTSGSLELLILFEKLFDLVLKGFGRVLGHLIPQKIENAIGEAIQAFALLIPVVLEGSRVKVTDNAGDVNICRTLEDLAGQRRPKVGLLAIPETLKLDRSAIGDEAQSPILLLATEYVDETYVLNRLMINLKFTTPRSCDDPTRKSQFVFLLSKKCMLCYFRGCFFNTEIAILGTAKTCRFSF